MTHSWGANIVQLSVFFGSIPAGGCDMSRRYKLKLLHLAVLRFRTTEINISLKSFEVFGYLSFRVDRHGFVDYSKRLSRLFCRAAVLLQSFLKPLWKVLSRMDHEFFYLLGDR